MKINRILTPLLTHLIYRMPLIQRIPNKMGKSLKQKSQRVLTQAGFILIPDL